jgi:hypothetical protein
MRTNELKSIPEIVPGNWSQATEVNDRSVKGRTGIKIHSDTGWCVGTWFDANWDGSCPTGRLLCAAPKLLAALKVLLRHVNCNAAGLEESRRFAEAKQAANDAIADAEGPSS